ncbi:MAG: RidA family protein [Chrysiogenetes bacterium]|nr:RidA family protein [Chrysiogenetes bacterium]
MDVISTPNAPRAIGPYSQAIRAGDYLFCSGQIALSPDNGELVGSDAAEQTKQVMENLRGVVEAAGGDLSKVVKTTIYLTDMNAFPQVNDVYGGYFSENPPARATVGVASLPKGALVEIEAVVFLG